MNYDIFKKMGDNKIRIEILERLSKDLFEKIVKRCIYSSENGGMNFKYEMKTNLKEYSSENEYKLIDGKNDVKKYWQFGTVDNIKNIYENIIQIDDLDKYGMKVILFNDKESLLINTHKHAYKFTNKYVIIDEVYGYHTELIEEKAIESEFNFKDSNCMMVNPIYYINICIDTLNGDDKNFDDYFGKYLRWIFEEIQQTYFIVSINDRDSLLKSFNRLVKTSGYYCCEPIEILRRNFFKKDGVRYIKENYSTGYCPVGDLCFLFIGENFSANIDGKIFIITRDNNVINTGRHISGFENSLLEGYYNREKNTFIITDILFNRGEDIRKSMFYILSAGSNEKMRHNIMLQFYREVIQKSVYINPDLRENSIKIVMAKYLFGNGSIVDDNLNELLDRASIQEYPVAGIQFRPINEEYPDNCNGGHWSHLMKWSYPSHKTLDFLVLYMKDGKNDKISPFQLPSIGKDEYGKIIYYKTLKLMVLHSHTKKLIEFSPRGGNQMSGFANIPLNEYDNIVANNLNKTEVIENNMVVSFLYQRIYGEHTNLFKWTPVAINHVKTKLYNEKKVSFGMSESYGNHMWNALNNQITESNLRDGSVPEEDLSAFYYAENTLRTKKYPFQIFHNRIVKDTLISSVCPAILLGKDEQIGSLLDLACGNGGDTSKWRLGKLKTVVGIDISKDNIDSGIELYKKVQKPRPDVTYIWGDCGKLIFPNFDSAMDSFSKTKMEKTFISKNQFDVVSLQFAIHYFFENEIMLRILLQNVSDNLKIGGYFIGTSLDGERVYNMLRDLKNDDAKEGKIGDDLLWKIKKDYEVKKWDKKKANLGHKIEVFVKTIGISHTEYLVNYDYLVEIAKDYGIEVVEINGFEKSYMDALEKNTEWDNDLKAKTPAEKQFSFLHNQFKFIKKKDASDSTYKKLITIVKNKEKKDEKMKGLENKKFIIKIRKG